MIKYHNARTVTGSDVVDFYVRGSHVASFRAEVKIFDRETLTQQVEKYQANKELFDRSFDGHFSTFKQSDRVYGQGISNTIAKVVQNIRKGNKTPYDQAKHDTGVNVLKGVGFEVCSDYESYKVYKLGNCLVRFGKSARSEQFIAEYEYKETA